MKIAKAIFCVLVFVLCTGYHQGVVTPAICSPGFDVVLYPDGTLQTCVLQDYFNISGVECNKQSQINFYENGRLKSCFLSRDTSISGQKCRQLTLIYFYPTGEFKSCVKQE